MKMRNNKEEQVTGRRGKTMSQTGGTVCSDPEAEEPGFPWGWSSGRAGGGQAGRQPSVRLCRTAVCILFLLC